MSDLKKVFRPEFLNRIDEVIVFHKLAKEEVKEIIDLMINRVRVQVAEHELQLELTDEAKDILVDKGWDPSMGARPLRRAIQRYIEDPLADEVLRQGEMVPGSTVMVERDASGDEEDKPLKLKIVKPKKPPKPKRQAGAREGRRRRQEATARTPRRAGGERRAAAPPTTPERRPSGPIGLRFTHARARPDGDRDLERRSLPALRGGDRRGAPRSAAAAGRGHRHRAQRRRLRPGRGRLPARRRSLAGVPRDEYCLVGAVGHDFYEGERDGPRGFPRFTDPALRGEDAYASYLRMAAERSLERLGVSSFDLLLLHNPDRTGYTSEAVWDGMAALREAGLTERIGVAPGPANGFTLDLISCLERFGDRIDWAMIILNPFEPWPGELCLAAAASIDVGVITRVVDYGGLFWGDLRPGMELAEGDHRAFRPARAGSRRGWRSWSGSMPLAERARLTPIQLACQWNLAHPAVECVVPTLIQEAGEPDACPIEEKRVELAALPAERRLGEEDVDAIRAIGDNTGCMALKGASPARGRGAPDRWALSDELVAVGERWGSTPDAIWPAPRADARPSDGGSEGRGYPFVGI